MSSWGKSWGRSWGKSWGALLDIIGYTVSEGDRIIVVPRDERFLIVHPQPITKITELRVVEVLSENTTIFVEKDSPSDVEQ